MLVVGDHPLAHAARQLKAEWKALAGGELKVTEMTDAELVAAESLAADAVIYPAHRIGILVERGWLAAVPREVLDRDELAWPEVFTAIQLGEVTWGKTVFAVPLGSPVLTCYYRPDLFEAHKKSPPRTWAEYQTLVEYFNHRDHAPADLAADAPWSGTIEPLAVGWGGRLLLARAASYARHRDNYSTLFQLDTMAPLVGSEPFVRALEELVKAAKAGPADHTNLNPAEIHEEFLLGHSAMALSWPTPAASPPTLRNSITPHWAGPVAFCELPGSERVYNFSSRTWETRSPQDSPHVPLLSIAGRLGSALQESPRTQSALELVAWLSGRQWSARVAGASADATLYRRDQAQSPRAWVEPDIDLAAATQYARATSDALSRSVWLFALRLPGEDDYMDALDEAVTSAISDVHSAEEALQIAADVWREITERLGVDKQRRAYLRSLGLADASGASP